MRTWQTLLLGTSLFADATAQCATTLVSSTVPAGLIVSRDLDGPGPMSAIAFVVAAEGAVSPNGIIGNTRVWQLDLATGMPTQVAPLLPFLARGAVVLDDGQLAVGGAIGTGPFSTGPRLSFWDGTNWSDVLVDNGSASGAVEALAVAPNGNLIVGGSFSTIAGIAVSNVARRVGTTWMPIGGLMAPAPGVTNPAIGGAVRDLLVEPNGDVIATGTFSFNSIYFVAALKRWNGTAWQPIGAPGELLGSPPRVLRRRNGNFVAWGPAMYLPGSAVPQFVAEWDGSSWAALGTEVQHPVGLVELPNGDLAVAGGVTFAGMPGGLHLGRWNDAVAAWAPLLTSPTPVDANALQALPDGTVVVGTVAAVHQLATTCAPLASSYGAGCVGSGGPNTLAADSPPWVGGEFRAVGDGMPANGIVLSVYGFAALDLPMNTVLPQALPGCSILMTADLLDVLLPAAGRVVTRIALPNASTLAGLTFHHYVVPFELDPMLAITAITSSNALTLTIGTY